MSESPILSVERRPIVVVLSPYRAKFASEKIRYWRYRQACIRHATAEGYAPYASHQMMTNALDDDVDMERDAGFECEESYLRVARHVFAYENLGISQGMHRTMQRLQELHVTGAAEATVVWWRLKDGEHGWRIS